MRPAPPPGALATAEVALDLGRGAAVALLHGVGVDASSLEEVAEHLSTTHRVIIIRRPAGRSLDEQAAAVIASLAEVAPGPVTLAGVSGGATLALAAAISWPADVRSVVAHEPLLGRTQTGSTGSSPLASRSCATARSARRPGSAGS